MSRFICCAQSAALAFKTVTIARCVTLTVEREDRIRGYEFAKDEYVQFTEAELERLETESSNNIEFKEFIPLQVGLTCAL